MKKEVLKLEYKDVFDMVAVRIVYQDEEVLKRGKFEDEEIGVHSRYAPLFPDEKTFLNIRGIRRDYDNQIMIVFKEEAEIIKEKVRRINEKYGIKERFKPSVYGTPYWYIDFEEQKVCMTFWCEDAVDLDYYKLNNCFKNQKQAEIALKRVKKILEQYQNELLEGEK